MSSPTSWLAKLDRRVLALVAVLVIAVLAAATAGGVYAYQQSLPTTTAFNVKAGEKEVRLDQPLTVAFSRPVGEPAVTEHFHLSPAADGKLTASPDRRAFTWTANAPYADLTTYTLALDPFTDAGHKVAGGRWSFTTTIVPRVTALETAAGAGVAAGSELTIGTQLKILFNTAMESGSVQLLANGQPATLAWADDKKSAAIDTKSLKVGGVDLSLAPGGKDLAGHALDATWKLSTTLVFKVNVHTTPLSFPALVQIPNDPSARDQSGLQSADMVFEYATEGGITRFTALFTNVPDKVGPVRSGRLISIKLARHYRGQLFLSGTSEGTFGVLERDWVPTFFDTQGYFYRTTDRFAPNNLYISGDAIARAEGTSGRGAYQLKTGSTGLSGGAAATSVDVAEHRSSYAFDTGTRTYTKTEDLHQLSDAAIAQPLHIAMLVVLHTQITTTSIIEDVNGAHGLDYNIDGTGSAEIYYQGARYTVHWSSPDRSSPLVFTTDSGQPVTMPSGLVWVDVVS